MHIKRRNGKYVLDYYVKVNEALRRREETFPTKKLAELAMAKRKVEIAEGKFLDVRRRPRLVFDEAVEKYMEWAKANKRSWDRDRTSLAHWKAELGGKPLSQIGKLDVERYKAKRKEQVAPRTVNEELACLKRLVNRMIDWGLAESNPVRGVRFLRQPPGRLKMLSPDEEKRLLDACCASLRPVVITALYTGMRRGEIVSLTWSDVDFHHGVIVVRDSKNGESRQIPMSITLRETMSALRSRSGQAERVFCSRMGTPYQSIRSAYEKAVTKAGLKDLHFHDLRHVFASNLRMQGVDLFLIKELLGQKSLDMTMRYAHITSNRKQEAIKALDRRSDSEGDAPDHGEFLESCLGKPRPAGVKKQA
jgi:integrase